ncbi:hypothetical protein ACFOY2_37745 [Nonomuraea purpurea]|uniref:Uncharacterized protein n=1 Tax=Nonomuraea purpurea TaxID=1849276 RepID=A0ABV8GGE5_9ACTN
MCQPRNSGRAAADDEQYKTTLSPVRTSGKGADDIDSPVRGDRLEVAGCRRRKVAIVDNHGKLV